MWSPSVSRPPFAVKPRELLLLGAGLLDRLRSREPKLSPPITRDAWTPDFSGNGFALKLGWPLDWSQSTGSDQRLTISNQRRREEFIRYVTADRVHADLREHTCARHVVHSPRDDTSARAMDGVNQRTVDVVVVLPDVTRMGIAHRTGDVDEVADQEDATGELGIQRVSLCHCAMIEAVHRAP